jgi:hypothetical protein
VTGIRAELENEDGRGRTVVLLLDYLERPASGKYVVGLSRLDPSITALVWDPGAAYHGHIAAAMNLQPRGGGWLEVDPAEQKIALTGHSHAFGREPNRGWTARTLERALPGWRVLAEE